MESLQGSLLIGGANIFSPAFRRTIVLIADHDENGALGFVLNRPAGELSEVPEPLAGLALADQRVFIGGPVQPEVVAVLGEVSGAAPSDRLIFGATALVSLDDALEPGRVSRAKIFAGYSGWGPGQLEAEMEEDSWLVEPAYPDDVFTTDPDDLWKTVLDRKGPDFQLLQTMPLDPSSN